MGAGQQMPTFLALEDFVEFSSLGVMEVEQSCLCCQFDAHVEENLEPLILGIIKPLHSEVLPKRLAISIRAHPCLLHLGSK